jgi:hypothetical protein
MVTLGLTTMCIGLGMAIANQTWDPGLVFSLTIAFMTGTLISNNS